jgi:hypothetical protein
MTPEQLTQFREMQETLARLLRAEDVGFVKSLERNSSFVTEAQLAALKLSDLADVEDTDSASTGEVLKKTATTWQPGVDNDTP